MATKRADEAKTQNANQSTPQSQNGTPGAEGTSAAAEVKVKPERLFGGNSNFQALRKAQSEVDTKYNRIGRKLKALELDKEDYDAIVEIMKKSHAKASQEAFAKATSGAPAEGTEQFV